MRRVNVAAVKSAVDDQVICMPENLDYFCTVYHN